MTPRLLVLGPLPARGEPIGGTTVSFDELVRRLREGGTFECDVVDTYRRTFGAGRFASALAGAAVLLRVLAQTALRVRRADVLLLNVSSGALLRVGPLIWVFARAAGRRLVVRVFGGDLDLACDRAPAWLRRLAESTVLQPDLLLLQTEALCRRFSSRARVSWLPTTRRLPADLPARRGACRRFLFLSQLRAEKGIEEALAASDRMPEGCTLTLHGPAPSERTAAEIARHARARWEGEVAPEEVREVLFRHDALVFPSWHSGEGLPGAVIEAMQCGLPVIAARWRAIEEVVEDGESGLLVAPRDAEALLSAMQRLAEDPALHERLSLGARVRGERFDAGPWHARLESWLLELCGQGHAHPLPLR